MKSTHSTLIAAAFLVALALTGTGPPAFAVFPTVDGGHAAPTTRLTTQDPESNMAARHRQMDAAWRVGAATVPATAPVTLLRRTTVSWVF